MNWHANLCMQMKKGLSQIQKLVMNNRVYEAIWQLLAFIKSNPEFTYLGNDLRVTYAKLSQIDEEKRTGILSYSKYFRQKTKINKTILTIYDKIVDSE